MTRQGKMAHFYILFFIILFFYFSETKFYSGTQPNNRRKIALNTLSAVRVFSQLWRILCRPSEYSIPWHRILCRPSRYLRKLRKYYVGCQSISAQVDGTLSAVGVLHLAASRTLSSVGVLHLAASRTMSAVGVFLLAASRTMSAVTILARNEEAFCRPSECLLLQHNAS